MIGKLNQEGVKQRVVGVYINKDMEKKITKIGAVDKEKREYTGASS